MKNGRLDPDWLGSAGLAFVRPWLRDRLSGIDPYQPIDPRYGEDPDEFVVGLLREVGAEHPAFAAISRAAAQLLDEARKAAPDVPAYFGSLLRICQRIALPLTSSWFHEELEALRQDVGSRNRREELWGGYRTVREILYAAVVQAPGLEGGASRRAWERLLEEPRYTTFAFIALSKTFPDEARYIAKWWTTCPVDERDRELESVLRSALENEGVARVRTILCAHAAQLPDDLKRAIDDTLRRLKHATIFGPAWKHARALKCAIEGAARKREYVLADLRDAAE